MKFAIRSILVATDLSTSSDEVLRSAALLSRHLEAELHVINAQEPTPLPGNTDVLGTQRRIHDARHALADRLDAALPAGSSVASSIVAFDRAHAAILRRAGEVEADLIVIGPHRTRPYGDAILGTTADRLVRTSSVPCLIVRREIEVPLSTVLVPSDLSRAARGALIEAFGWADSLGEGSPTTVRVLHVDINGDADATLEEAGVAVERELLNLHIVGAIDMIGEPPASEIVEEVVAGSSPAEEILRAAERIDPSLVVMGTHGDGALMRTLIGSVSSWVARQVTAPVLLVPPTLWRSRERAAGETPALEAPLPLVG